LPTPFYKGGTRKYHLLIAFAFSDPYGYPFRKKREGASSYSGKMIPEEYRYCGKCPLPRPLYRLRERG
jgi:hypothetical protein